MSSISSVNCDFLLVWRLFRNLMNTRLRNLTITSQAIGFGVKYPEPTILERFIEKGARVLKAVVFDMDETLLSINLNAFILRYFKDSLSDLIQSQFIIQNRHSNKDLPDDFLVNHISGSFVEMVLWWIKGRMKQTPEELDRYFRSVIEPIL